MSRRGTLVAFVVVLSLPGILGKVPQFAESRSVEAQKCGVGDARETLQAFFQSLAERRVARTDALFAAEPLFEWYSTTAPGARLRAEARRRSTLPDYLRARIAKRERLRLLRANVVATLAPDEQAINGYVVRRANDLRPTRFGFKAQISCAPNGRNQIFVWSMARADSR